MRRKTAPNRKGSGTLKNAYEVRGDVTTVFLHRKSGEIVTTIIDTADLKRAATFPNTWVLNRASTNPRGYVLGMLTTPSGRRGVSLHRWLMEPPTDLVVDHINHDGLDNRRANLRIVTQRINLLNPSGLRRTNTSGYCGVSWNKRSRKWQAMRRIDGVQTFLGNFIDKHDAHLALQQSLSADSRHAA